MSYATALINAGCDAKLAEIHAEKQAEVIKMLVTEQMITKADVKNLETEMKLGFADVRHQLNDIRTTIDNLDKKFEHKFEIQDEKIEQRFKAQNEKIEQRFKAQDEKFDQRFKAQDEKLQHGLTSLETTLRHEMKAMSHSLLIKLTVIMGSFVGLLDFLHRFQVI